MENGELLKLWNGTALTASQLAAHFGVPRPTVLSRLHKLRAKGEIVATRSHANGKKKTFNTAPKVQRQCPQAAAEVLSLGKRQCKWPIGHPEDADFHFCKSKRYELRPYCQHHLNMSKAPPREK